MLTPHTTASLTLCKTAGTQCEKETTTHGPSHSPSEDFMGVGGLLVVVIGLAVIVAIGVLILLLVAIPSLRAEGRISASARTQRFRLPRQWTGYDDEIYGFFGGDDETSHLATREQAAVTAMREHSYVLKPQPRRHAAPKLFTLRPRTRHWKVPETGTGLRTALSLLFK